MNLKQAKKLRKAAKIHAGEHWKRAYWVYKRDYKYNPVPLMSLKMMHATIQREAEGTNPTAVGEGFDPSKEPRT